MLVAACLAAGSLIGSACVIELDEATDGNDNEFIDGVSKAPGSDGDPGGEKPGGSDPGIGGSTTPPQPDSSVAPGGLCSCDKECQTIDGREGMCVYGVCMTRASATCSSAGSTSECGAGSRCWSMEGENGSICWPDCSSYDCQGTCDPDNSCVPNDTTNCDYSCGSYCSCQEGDCAAGESCVSGKCMPDVMSDDNPGKGPGPTCNNLPQRDCSGPKCSDIVVFDPRVTPHYDDYPINGEKSYGEQYRSYIRRDLKMLIAYASARTLCKSAAWKTGNGGALGLGDMSEANGAVPGTSVGQPGHPASTHTNGFDIDLAYYQKNTANNYLRPICQHADYHCSAAPHLLDVWRTAMFLGSVFESNRVRVVGVDGQAGTVVTAAINELCTLGWLDSFACSHVKMAFEVTNMGYGWFQFHHHHAHISMCPGSSPCNNLLDAGMPKMGPGFDAMPLKRNPYLFKAPAF
jgi:hypothetical protein